MSARPKTVPVRIQIPLVVEFPIPTLQVAFMLMLVIGSLAMLCTLGYSVPACLCVYEAFNDDNQDRAGCVPWLLLEEKIMFLLIISLSVV